MSPSAFKKKPKNEESILSGRNISDDSFLLSYVKKRCEQIRFFSDDVKELIINIDENRRLNIQTQEVIDIWKVLMGDSIVFLKKYDAREKYHDSMKVGLDDLCSYLEEFHNFESILYGAVPYYRDHINHVFRTYLLGDYLIKSSFGYDYIGPKINDLNITSHEKEAMWCIISLSHDLGYPLQGIKNINEKARNIINKFGPTSISEFEYSHIAPFEKLCDFTLNFMSSDLLPTEEGCYVIHIQPKYVQKYMSALVDLNHGVLSGILLMKDLVYFKESDFMLDHYKPLEPEDARQFLIRRDILRSIASHGCSDIYHLTIPNFPFLLMVVDEMQEWGRPRLEDVTKRVSSVTELGINHFSSNVVDYRIGFSFPNGHEPDRDEIIDARAEAQKYFEMKSKKWSKVLRSAVGGKHRDLKLIFTVRDLTSEPLKEYKLTHENPEKVTKDVPS